MDKWEYIRLISKRGDSYGCKGGVYELLLWSGKQNTFAVTEAEAKAFWENYTENETAPPNPLFASTE